MCVKYAESYTKLNSYFTRAIPNVTINSVRKYGYIAANKNIVVVNI